MSTLLTVHSLSKSFSTQKLFQGISFTLSQGDRVGLLGPNGAGKSTLLEVLMDIEPPDEGFISRRQNLRVGYSCQSPEFPPLPLEELLVKEVPHLDEIEALTRARILLGKAQFTDFTQNASLLSGGGKKRLDIIRALMNEPDLLLLDEPTNHLDLEGILWLEKFLLREKISFLLVSHDRYFVDNVCNKIMELNKCYPQGVFTSEGNMSTFLEHKEAFLLGQQEQERSLRSQVRDEIEWLRRMPKARTTKSQARVQKAQELISELSEVKKRNLKQKVDLEFSASERQTRKLIVANNITKSLGEKTLFKGINLTLSPGTRLGIVGRNGTGKTTLLRILAGQIPQDMGTLKYADNIRLVYFDQHRERIPSDISLREALSPHGDMINYRGQWIHVNGWAKKFLFQTDRLEMPVNCLSGGERARILIARLMLEPADVLFLDEPTNDLDIPTLEIMEESLKEFEGAVVLISHDRCLMDNLCTQIVGLGNENEEYLFADYLQWERASLESKSSKQSSIKPQTTSSPPPPPPSKKLSYKEQKELEGMESSILITEQEIEKLQKQLENPQVSADGQKSLEIYRLLGEAQTKLDTLFERWQYLLNKTKGIE